MCQYTKELQDNGTVGISGMDPMAKGRNWFLPAGFYKELENIMPGFTTHYLFGTDACHRLSAPGLRRDLCKNHQAFALGLQGPDLFFYYFPGYLKEANGLGQLVHNKDTQAFFSYLMESRYLFAKVYPSEAAADAYICGFLGHYTLDCSLHPYVYAFTNYRPEFPQKSTEYFGQHAYLETELDKLLLWQKKKLPPSRFRQDKTIVLNRVQRKIITQMLTYAYRNTYPGIKVSQRMMRSAPKWMRLGTRLLNDPSGQKKVLVRLVEQKLFHRAFISPMLPSDHYFFVEDPMNKKHQKWTHPWTKEVRRDSFNDLYKNALDLYLQRLEQYDRMLRQGYSPQAQKAFAAELGNRSFLSGEPLS